MRTTYLSTFRAGAAACAILSFSLPASADVAAAPTQPTATLDAAATAAPPAKPAGQKLTAEEQKRGAQVVRKLIGAIRYNKDEIAAGQLGFDRMTQALMGPTAWSQMSPQQQAQAAEWVSVLVRQASFARGRDVYGYIDAVTFAANRGQRDGDSILLPSTVVVHRDLKKTEMAVTWVLAPQGSSLKIIDTITAGDSLCAGIHEDEVEPLLKKAGITAVMDALQSRAKKAASEAKAAP